MIFSFKKEPELRSPFSTSDGVPLSCQPAMIEFAKHHGLDLGPGGSTIPDLYVAICDAINKLDAKQGGA